ncbi:unnamed protein product [Orchesella dallaii]|uniref:S1 motif domain-containing protein n=1 Tax=Orchesella dallaii TaxID=48710 RepID=A0ABP1PUY1_9HEXA
MVDREEYFPRGKESPDVAKVDGVGVCGKGNNGEEQAQLSNKTNNQEKPLEAKLEDKETLAGNRRQVEEKKFAVVPLTYDQIMEGMLSIGIVSRIRDHDMYISLPGRTGGTVSINNISTPYLNIMEKYEGESPSTDDEVCVYTLKELFQIGQQVVVKVLKVERSETSTKIYLTMNPQDLHEFYSTAVLEEDLVLIAAVQSKDDHGYVMDFGIAGVRCFLPKADADEYIKANQNRPLGIGQLMYCKIKKTEVHLDQLDDNIIVTVMPTELRRQKMDEITTLNYSALMPGMLVDAIVMETHKTGIVIHFMDFNGLIYQDHMSERWTTPETLEIGSTVPARVFYILPNLTSPYLTLQTDLLPLAQTADRTDFKKLGAKLEVTVVRIEKRGVIVRFEDDDKGIIPINQIGNQDLLKVKLKDISEKYKKNSTHPCRVLQYMHVERMYLCSFKKEKLANDILHIQQATCGKVVSCKILGWNMEGVRVQVGSAIQGYIPDSLDKRNTFLDSAKEKLIGTTIKARIMQRDIEQNILVLTTHKELVMSNGVVLTSVEEAEVGMKGHAIIKTIDKTGAFVNAIGGVEGLIPRAELIRIGLAGFAESVLPGQIIKYKVLEKNNEKNQLVLSAILKGKEFNTEYLENLKDPEFWKAAVSHYSVLGHLDKARRVAKQALDTIDYRKVKGKREVWGSLLQLEMKYGTEETVKKTYAEALEQNDEFEWMKLAAKVYDLQHRSKDVERIYRKMTKKFPLEPEAWIRLGKFHFFKQNFGVGREVLPQALKNVPAVQQLLVITNFALLEMHHGDQSKGEQMLDRVLEQHPQRSDLWLVYANALIKVGEYDKSRTVFQRSLENNWPRKVKLLLHRYRELENDHGNESTRVEFYHYVDALKEKIKDEEEYSEVSPQKGRQEKRKFSSNSESDSQVESDESESSKKEKRKKNKKMKSVPETVSNDSEFGPEANEMEVDMTTESSDLKEGGQDESVSDSDEEPDQSKSKIKKKSDAAVADVPETVGLEKL